jgi:hypothetical protein
VDDERRQLVEQVGVVDAEDDLGGAVGGYECLDHPA